MAPRKPKPPPGKNFLYMTPGSKQTAAQIAAVKKAATKAPAKATARNRSAANATTGMTSGGGSGANPRNRSETPGGSGRANRASSGTGSQPLRTSSAGKKAAASAPGKRALATADKFMQAVADKRDVFKTTEADPMGWASIAEALGNAGDARFKKFATGSRGTTEAKKYVRKHSAQKNGPK